MKLSGLIAFLGVTAAATAQTLTHSQAAARFSSAGITSRSSGGCTDRNIPTCTSFDGIRTTTVNGAITLKNACGCAITITGGTETGHAGGQYSHGNGYKLDFAKASGINSYVTNTFTRIANRGDGYPQWQARSGNIYCVSPLLIPPTGSTAANTQYFTWQDEGSHWDVTFYTDGS